MSDLSASSLMQVDPAEAWAPFDPSVDGAWNRRLAAHLLRRVGFGASPYELERAVSKSPADVVAELIEQAQAEAGEDVSQDALATAMLATGKSENLAAWWLHRMLHSPSQLLEKITLFWHGHFATSADKVTEARLMFDQNRLLREHGLGDFGSLTQAVARDPAMLIYLDSATNRKAHPNENFARELMELFCLGEGHYSERDIQELARCFTGWEVKRNAFRFNRYQSDNGEKSVLGRSGPFTGEDGVQIVLDQDQASRFIVQKLIRFFVCDEPAAPDHLVEPLARQMRDGGLQIAPVLQTMLSSRLFYSTHAMARRVRSPIELVVGLVRSLDATISVPPVASALKQLGHALFFPPNVKGWDGGRTWINTSTVLGRANLVSHLLHNEHTRFDGSSLHDWLRQHDAGGPEAAVDLLAGLLIAVPLSTDVRSKLIAVHSTATGSDDQRLRQLLHALTTLPEYHLV